VTDQLDGRDLDRACAEAMGWTHMIPGPDWIMPEVLHWLRPDGSFKGSLPSFSTDPSTQAEKLAFLQQPDGAVGIDIRNGEATATVWSFADLIIYAEATGTTIDQALARLIVAVAKAKKEQGK